MKAGRRALFLFLPEGEDPDSLVRAEGRDAFERRLEGAVPLSRFVFDHLAAEVDPGTPEGGARFVDGLRPLLERTPAGPFRNRLVTQVGELYAARAPARSRNQIDKWFEALSRDDSAKGLRRLGDQVREHTERLRSSESPATRAIRMLLHHPSLAGGAIDVDLLRAADTADCALLADIIETFAPVPICSTVRCSIATASTSGSRESRRWPEGSRS